jgi:uncharacterized membrane protein YidH (DUF202 family)
MSEESLERGYRRLLAWYPRPFRAEQGEEILAVLMSGAQRGQRRPRLAEAVDLIRSAVRMRLWPLRSGPERRDLADGLATFSLLAPLFLLAAAILMVALPYRLPASPLPLGILGPHQEIGGLSLLRLHFFDIAVGCEVIVAVLVLLGQRLLALLAIPALAAYFAVSSWWIPWIPYPLQLITAGVLLLEMAALIASPGPRRGRELVNWRHGVVLAAAAGAFQGFALWYVATSRPMFELFRHPVTPAYVLTGVALAVAAVVLALLLRLNRYFLLVFAAACYPLTVQLAFSAFGQNLLGNPTPARLTVLFLPPVLLVLGLVGTAGRRARAEGPAKPASPARPA